MRKITIKYICIQMQTCQYKRCLIDLLDMSIFIVGNLYFYEVIKHIGNAYIEAMKNNI